MAISKKKKENTTEKSIVTNVSFALGLGLLSFIFFTITLSSIAFLFHGGISPVWLILSLLISITLTYWRLVKTLVIRPYIWVGVLIVIITGAVAFSSQTLDSTWDGNDYHKTAIGELKDGWNPVWEEMLEFHNSSRNPMATPGREDEFRDYLTNWTDHYAKASWIFAANIYKVTGNIESGKAITILSMFLVLFFALSFFYKLFDRNKAIIIALLLTFNPVVITQVFNYYNDGILGNYIIVLLLLFSMLIFRKLDYTKDRIIILTAITMAIVPVVNLKFSALAYVAIVAAVYYIYLLFKKDWKLVRDVTVTGLISIVLGVFVVGASSYVLNTITHQNPIYPLAGEGKIDIMAIQQPVGYAEQPGIKKFIANNLYATTNLSYDLNATETPQLKVPFTISLDELAILEGTSDARQAGYGVWFGGILIVSTIAAIYLVLRYARKYAEYLPIILLPLATVAITVLVFDNTWWARYLPQLIIFPVIVIVVLFALRAKTIPYVIAFMLFFNVILTGLLGIGYQVNLIKETRAAITTNLKCDKDKSITIGYGRFYGALYNMKDQCDNITVTHKEYDELPKDKVVPIYEMTYKVLD